MAELLTELLETGRQAMQGCTYELHIAGVDAKMELGHIYANVSFPKSPCTLTLKAAFLS